jgi:2-polyprenyl-3-methyl-5-hydroxy-6-metoxy-1,4-benzoquinol methylase
MGEIIEHFHNPIEILVKAKELLKKNGKILITTPNMPSVRNRLKFGIFGIFPDNNPQHKYYFDYKRLSEVVSEAGYDILYFKTKFVNIMANSELITKIENILFFGVNKIFKLSGDVIFAVISPIQK